MTSKGAIKLCAFALDDWTVTDQIYKSSGVTSVVFPKSLVKVPFGVPGSPAKVWICAVMPSLQKRALTNINVDECSLLTLI